MRIIDTGDKILSGDNHPQLKIGDKLYLVDDRKSTWDKIQVLQTDEGFTGNIDEEVLRLALGEKAVKELLSDENMTVAGFQNLNLYVISAITGEDVDELKKAARERKN